MNRKSTILLVLAVLICCGSCTNTRYLTDQISIERQHDMKVHRAGGNVGDVLINFGNFFIAAIYNSGYEVYSGERIFRKIEIVNQSNDSLHVNMVTDVLWKDNEYCDIMGIELPPGAKKKLLVPFPAAYNVYFKTPTSEEESLEIRTDGKLRIIKLEAGMTRDSIKSESGQ